MNIEHPMITQINATGYPKGVAVVDVVRTDYFGDEIFSNDEYVIDRNAGEMILVDNLERYLKEQLDFTFVNEI
ncbi:YqaI family protein [Bacillus altitudinis]|uniref:YqaI family protein n=1 Tax=Bacillus altitudinis TaxID=293387 RepID=UPI003CFD101E